MTQQEDSSTQHSLLFICVLAQAYSSSSTDIQQAFSILVCMCRAMPDKMVETLIKLEMRDDDVANGDATTTWPRHLASLLGTLSPPPHDVLSHRVVVSCLLAASESQAVMIVEEENKAEEEVNGKDDSASPPSSNKKSLPVHFSHLILELIIHGKSVSAVFKGSSHLPAIMDIIISHLPEKLSPSSPVVLALASLMRTDPQVSQSMIGQVLCYTQYR